MTLDSVTKGAGHTKSQAAELFANFDGSKLDALVETMVLAASADGDFSDDERVHLESALTTLAADQGKPVEPSQLKGWIESAIAGLKDQGRPARVLALKERLSVGPERKAALAVAIDLAFSDGEVRTTERELIMELAEGLAIDRDEAADLVKAVGSKAIGRRS